MNKPPIFLIAGFGLAISVSGAASQECKGIQDDQQRLSCYDQAPAKTPPLPKAAAPKSEADPLIAKARAAVANSLRDPPSARFDGVVRKPEGVCGFVNAKNAYGGYGGRTRFVYIIKTAAIYVEFSPALMSPANVYEYEEIDAALTKYCPGVKSPFIK